jgi:hypothetical protein
MYVYIFLTYIPYFEKIKYAYEITLLSVCVCVCVRARVCI